MHVMINATHQGRKYQHKAITARIKNTNPP